MRIGVIGAGAIAPSHIFAIEQIERAELAAVCDQVAERAAALAGERGVPHFGSVREMLAYPELPQYLEIFGSRGTLTFSSGKLMRLDLIDPTAEEAAAREELFALSAELEAAGKKARAKVAPDTAVPVVDMGHRPVIADFVGAILEDREPKVGGPEARRAVELITGIYESGRNGSRLVRLRGEK